MAFTNATRQKKMMRRPLVDLKSFIIATLHVPDLSIGDTAAQLDQLNVMGLIGPCINRSQVAALNHQSQRECCHHNEQKKAKHFL